MTGLSRPRCPRKRRDQPRAVKQYEPGTRITFYTSGNMLAGNTRRVSCGFLAKLLLLFFGKQLIFSSLRF